MFVYDKYSKVIKSSHRNFLIMHLKNRILLITKYTKTVSKMHTSILLELNCVMQFDASLSCTQMKFQFMPYRNKSNLA